MSFESMNAKDSVRTFLDARERGCDAEVLSGLWRRAANAVEALAHCEAELAETLRKRLGPAPAFCERVRAPREATTNEPEPVALDPKRAREELRALLLGNRSADGRKASCPGCSTN